MAERFAASRFVAKSRTGAKVAADSFDGSHASLASRVLAYLIDSIALFGVAAVFLTAAGLAVLLSTDGGDRDVSDAAIWTAVGITLATFPAWLLLNLLLGFSRGQSIGQYVVGIRVVRENGRDAGALRHMIRWLALHPLLFHPFFGGLWLSLSIAGLFLLTSEVVFVATVSVVLLCLVAPIASLIVALGDGQRRGLHDLIAGTKLVRIE